MSSAPHNSLTTEGIGSPKDPLAGPGQWEIPPEVAGLVHCVNRGKIYADGSALEDTSSLIDLFASQPGAMVFDPGVASTVARSGGVMTSIRDCLSSATATAAAAGGAGHEPEWVASDPLFCNQPSFVCRESGSKFLALTLPTPYPAGTRISLFAVFRTIGGTSGNRVVFCAFDASTSIFAGGSQFISLNANDSAMGPHVGCWYGTNINREVAVDTQAADDYAHCAWVTSRNSDNGRGNFALDNHAEGSGADPAGIGTFSVPITRLGIGGQPFGNVGDIAIAFAAITAGSPTEVLRRASALARQRFGCLR